MAETIDMDELLEDELKARQDRGDYLEEEEDDDDENEEELEEEEDEQNDEDDDESTESEEEDEEDGEDEKESEKEPEEEELDVNLIPQPRFNEVVAQKNAYKERSEWLQDQLEKVLSSQQKAETEALADVEEYDYDAAEAKFTKLVVEGEAEEAALVRKEIDSERKKEMSRIIENVKKEALKYAEENSKTTVDEDRFQTLVELYETEYPFLDKENDKYNEEAVDTVNTLMSGYIASGESKASALKKAVKRSVPFYESPKNISLGGKRKKAAVKRNVKASKSQPAAAKTSKSEKITEEIDVAKLSDKQFRELSKRELAKLRGDVF